MTLAKRLVVCLDVRGSRVVKGSQFQDLRDVGDPVELAVHYEAAGADEIVFLDISATADERRTMLDVVQRTAERLFIPLTVGGGIRTTDDVARALRAGADKVSINSAAVVRPALIAEAAARFGSQCVVASIDAKRCAEEDRWRVYVSGGMQRTDLDAVAWAKDVVARGAGEILLTSIDRDGCRDGYDLALIDAVASAVTVPVIASGGAGEARHVAAALRGGAEAALVAGILHDGTTRVQSIRAFLSMNRIPMRVVT
jgi:cyclase